MLFFLLFIISTFSLSNAIIFNAGSLPLAIPDLGSATSSIVISDVRTVSSVKVSVSIAHSFIGDLNLTLIHVESQVRTELISRPGCSEANILALFDDSSSVIANTICIPPPTPALNGTYRPLTFLSNFRGKPIAGTWNLFITDNAAQDTGSLNRFSLDIIPETNSFYDAPGLPIPILDFGSAISTIIIPDIGIVTSMAVSIFVSHTYIGDLSYVLSHNGISVRLMSRPRTSQVAFGCAGTNPQTLFFDSAGVSTETCTNTSPGLIGNYTSIDPLSAFTGTLAFGSWTLNISDAASPDTGFLAYFGLLFSGCGSNENVDNQRPGFNISSLPAQLNDNLCGNESDWYNFMAPDSQFYRVFVSLVSNNVKTTIFPLNATSSIVNITGSGFTSFYATAGSFWEINLSSVTREFYQLEIEGVGLCVNDTYEPNNDISQASLLTVSDGVTSVVTATACPLDQDWYQFSLSSGGIVNITVVTYDNITYPVSLYDVNGTRLFTSVPNSGFLFASVPAGVYLFLIDALDSGNYTVFITTTASSACTGIYEPNDNFPGFNIAFYDYIIYDGTCSISDVDYFYFTATASVVRVSLFDIQGVSNTLQVLNNQGNPIFTVSQGNYGFLTASQSTQYSLKVSPVIPGLYQLQISILSACVPDIFEPNNDFAVARTISGQGSRSLSICPQDIDFFKFQTFTSGTFSMTVVLSSPVVLRVTALNGLSLVGNWTGSNVISFNFAVTASTYYITIAEINNSQQVPYFVDWDLSVAPITSGDVTTSRVTSGGVTTGRRITTGRITTGRTTGIVTTEFPNSGRRVTTFAMTGFTTGTGNAFTTGPVVTTEEVAAVKSSASLTNTFCFVLLIVVLCLL